MKIAVTGADQGLARKLCNQLAGVYELIGWGQSASAPASEWEYKCVDLGRREEVEQALVGLDALVHAAPFDPPDPQSDQAEAQLLDWVARGTYGLVMEAAKAGIGRLVLISRLSLLEDYPEEFLVGENWMPRPRPRSGRPGPLRGGVGGPRSGADRAHRSRLSASGCGRCARRDIDG